MGTADWFQIHGELQLLPEVPNMKSGKNSKQLGNQRMSQELRICVPYGTICLLTPGMKSQLDWLLSTKWSSELEETYRLPLETSRKRTQRAGDHHAYISTFFLSSKHWEVSFGPTTVTKSVNVKTSTKKILRSNWLYWTIHELGSISSNKLYKAGSFYGEKLREERNLLEEEKIISGKGTSL